MGWHEAYLAQATPQERDADESYYLNPGATLRRLSLLSPLIGRKVVFQLIDYPRDWTLFSITVCSWHGIQELKRKGRGK